MTTDPTLRRIGISRESVAALLKTPAPRTVKHGHRTPPDLAAQVVAMYGRGMTVMEISEATRLSRSGVYKLLPQITTPRRTTR